MKIRYQYMYFKAKYIEFLRYLSKTKVSIRRDIFKIMLSHNIEP